MELNGRSVLVVSLDPAVLMRIIPLLWNGPFDVSTPATPLLALRAIDRRGFQLIITRYPVEGVGFGEIVDRVRAPDGPCQGASLVAVAPPELVEEAEQFLGGGVSRVVSTAASESVLENAFGALLDVAPRASSQLMLDLEVRMNGSSCRLLTQTINLSRSGMLIRSSRELALGAPVGFSLQLPAGNAVRGEGEIVRKTDPRRERVDGFGIRILSLEEQSAGLLKHYLANALEAQMPLMGREN